MSSSLSLSHPSPPLTRLFNHDPRLKRALTRTTAKVLILSHATTIKKRYQAMLHIGPVCQTCAVIDIDREFIRTGDRATVAFRFVQRPEFLAPGDRLLFREGRTKGLGIVKALGYDPEKPLAVQADPAGADAAPSQEDAGGEVERGGRGVRVGV